jgi:EAL domain-containing protein (putative c-di-GMP-specific phosphodiesterase class I)
VQLGQALGLDTIVEGIESIDQFEQIRDLGCPYGQGYLFVQPLSEKAVAALLRVEAEGGPVFPVFERIPSAGHLRVV